MPDEGEPESWRIRPLKKSRLIRASVLGVELVDLTYHAQKRMEMREITLEDVLSTLRHATETGLPAEPGAERFRWQKDRRTFIDVVFARKSNRIGIITVWKTTRSLIRRTRRQH
jgi:hypothetical protein